MKKEYDQIRLIDCLKALYGLAATSLILLPIGADMNASVFKLTTRDGQSYFVKLKRGTNSDISVTLLALLQASGIHQIIPPTKEFVLCHSDIHAGNVLVDESGSIYIVDWDEPIIAPKERDLMFIGAGVANVWNNPYEEELFYKGYGKTHINGAILTYYRHERIVQDILEYAQALLMTSDDGENRLEMYQQFLGMFEKNGVVDIAFKTDERYFL